ncbi:HsdM family class I SAM-dependent methyltransferase [Deinococcus sp.]|uniref:HsdM family class I SAM-dependent methyltransferase n=1 Tax=Deinococcus sp. TaxID=47478 RepID=UPI003B58E620
MEPNLPRIAAGYNGTDLVLSFLSPNGNWVEIKSNGVPLQQEFPVPQLIRNGISANGNFKARQGYAGIVDLRSLLSRLKTIYRVIPILSSGRNPVDFTIALLTLRLLVEQNKDWGTWAEQDSLVIGSKSKDHAIAERILVLVDRILNDPNMKRKYGDIFNFKDSSEDSEISFNFKNILSKIERGREHFSDLFKAIDELPPIEHSNFDVFGEVFQWIGDESTKKALGEFFTGRHIISAIMPILFERSGISADKLDLYNLKIADIACGTGGFLTEALRYIRDAYILDTEEVKNISKSVFFGYDIGHANASRARVNMYFAGDGFSDIRGGFDSLSEFSASEFPSGGFDFVTTNPPYGKSAYGRSEEAFLLKSVDVLKNGGWGLIVLPSGVLENPRSSDIRYRLLRSAKITDIISLPKHAFSPYTQQKTSIIVFQKRKSISLTEAGSWDEIGSLHGNEKISLYIVDNDGYANSDKRYPTNRTGSDGSFLHNELSHWQDKSGTKRLSHLANTLINDILPSLTSNEFGIELDKKYEIVRVKDLLSLDR